MKQLIMTGIKEHDCKNEKTEESKKDRMNQRKKSTRVCAMIAIKENKSSRNQE